MTDKKETVPYAPYFADGDGYAGVEWRNDFVAEVREADGTVVFRQEGVEAPSFWSARAVNTVGSKYFRGAVDTPERENSVRQIIDRVVNKTVEWGVADGYFDEDAGEAFGEDLRWLLVHQYGSFNSPVWFNLGVNERPQCAACFLLSVKDTMEGIMDLAKTEALIFRDGSGCGTNLSTLRSTADVLSGGGKPSGPVSFMRIYDTAAGVIRSGGKSRRSAKMNMLNSDHPDIMEFIRCKAHEELKAYALERAGYSGGLDGEAAMSVFFQNINISVRASDAFMEAVENDGDWPLRLVKDHEKVVETVKARSIMRAIAEGTHQCGDPGMMFDDTINGWNPVLNTERINTCNPCAEVHFVDDSACNLASLNLLKFLKEDGTFDVDGFQYAAIVFFIAQDIFVDRAAYPTEAVAQNSYKHRPLGLGYANLGALLMAKGLPYDSDEGRSYAAAVTDLMQATAYNTSVELARCLGPCASFEPNRGSFGAVLEKHLAAHEKLSGVLKDGAIWAAAEDQWAAASVRAATQSGVRNMQMSLLAPTGTISFMMDCDTTGCEPDMALVKIKALAGGGEIRMVNQTVPQALRELGYYDQDAIAAILEFVEENGTIEGAPGVKDEHLPVFDCAFRPVKGKRFISHHGHIKMLAAIQPFLSGAISKTVNTPEETTVEEIEQIYIDAWKLGLKAVAIYRNNSKQVQPVTLVGDDDKGKAKKDLTGPPPPPERHRLKDTRESITHKFIIGEHEGYFTVGLYPNGRPGELFVRIAKEGSLISGLMDTFATALSIMLQYGVSLEMLIRKFSFVRFEPSGFTGDRRIGGAKSIVDYIFRWMDHEFCDGRITSPPRNGSSAEPQVPGYRSARGDDTELLTVEKMAQAAKTLESARKNPECIDGIAEAVDTKPCPCGEVMVRSGKCYLCLWCGTSEGCS